MASLKAHPASEVKTPYPDSVLNPPVKCETDNCSDPIVIKTLAKSNNISMHLAGRTLFINGTDAASLAKVDVFDMQGRPVFSRKAETSSVDLNNIAEGLYVVRINTGSASLIQQIAIK